LICSGCCSVHGDLAFRYPSFLGGKKPGFSATQFLASILKAPPGGKDLRFLNAGIFTTSNSSAKFYMRKLSKEITKLSENKQLNFKLKLKNTLSQGMAKICLPIERA